MIYEFMAFPDTATGNYFEYKKWFVINVHWERQMILWVLRLFEELRLPISFNDAFLKCSLPIDFVALRAKSRSNLKICLGPSKHYATNIHDSISLNKWNQAQTINRIKLNDSLIQNSTRIKTYSCQLWVFSARLVAYV
jgi:hypothetical protein